MLKASEQAKGRDQTGDDPSKLQPVLCIKRDLWFSTHTQTLMSKWHGLIKQSVACWIDHWNLLLLFCLSLKSAAAVPQKGVPSNRRYPNGNFTSKWNSCCPKKWSCLLLKNNKASREERRLSLFSPPWSHSLTQREQENIIYVFYFPLSSVSCRSLRRLRKHFSRTGNEMSVSCVLSHDFLPFVLWCLWQWRSRNEVLLEELAH